MQIGDMLVVGQPPARFIKALAVISKGLHHEFTMGGQFAYPEKSKESCVVASLAVRDFLRRIGFDDARVLPVYCVMRAELRGELVHSVGIGKPDESDEPGRWSGHMVVVVPSIGYLIDTTLYPATRPQWEHLTGMMAVPLEEGLEPAYGFPVIAGQVSADADDPSDRFIIMWMDTRENKRWREGPDAKRRNLRDPVVKKLVQMYGKWTG